MPGFEMCIRDRVDTSLIVPYTKAVFMAVCALPYCHGVSLAGFCKGAYKCGKLGHSGVVAVCLFPVGGGI